jgi:hypothetical protein
MPTPSPQELFDRLVARLAAEPYRTAGLDAALQFDIGGPAGGRWYLKAAHGRVQVGHGLVERPTLTARMSQTVLADIASGRLSGEDAFRSAVQLEGETTLGIYLGGFFGP